jgi:hypothetical protein
MLHSRHSVNFRINVRFLCGTDSTATPNIRWDDDHKCWCSARALPMRHGVKPAEPGDQGLISE